MHLGGTQPGHRDRQLMELNVGEAGRALELEVDEGLEVEARQIDVVEAGRHLGGDAGGSRDRPRECNDGKAAAIPARRRGE